MSPAERSPGPWSVELGDRTTASTIFDAKGRPIADVHSHVFETGNYADVHLIGAAPELLEAVALYCLGNAHREAVPGSTLAIARAALDKATGSAS